MIDYELLQEYQILNRDTYQVYEEYLIHDVNRYLSNNLTLREVYLMLQIKEQAQKRKNSAKELAELMGYTQNSFSNLLRKLDRKGFLIRIPNQSDKRILDVFLTDAGDQMVLELETYFFELKQMFKKELGYVRLWVILRGLQKSTTVCCKTVPVDSSTTNQDFFSKTFLKQLVALYFLTHGSDSKFVSGLEEPILIKDMLVVQKIIELDGATLTRLNDILPYPFQTIKSILQKLIGFRYLLKIENKNDKRSTLYVPTNRSFEASTEFMKLRIYMIQFILKPMSKLEQTLVLRALYLIRTKIEQRQTKEA